MLQDWEVYEAFIASLVKAVKDNGRPIEELGFGLINKVVGVSGVKHQIDVSFIDKKIPQASILYLIECKYLEAKIDIDVARVARATHEDIATLLRPKNITVKTRIATTVGATKPAAKFAEYYGIQIDTIDLESGFSWLFDGFGIGVAPLTILGG